MATVMTERNHSRRFSFHALSFKNRAESKRLCEKLDFLEKSRAAAMRKLSFTQEQLVSRSELPWESPGRRRLRLPIINEKTCSLESEQQLLICRLDDDKQDPDGLVTTYAESLICLNHEESVLESRLRKRHNSPVLSENVKEEVRKTSCPASLDYSGKSRRRSGTFFLLPDVVSRRDAGTCSSSVRRHKSLNGDPRKWRQFAGSSPPPSPTPQCMVKSQSHSSFQNLTSKSSPVFGSTQRRTGTASSSSSSATSSPLMSPNYCAACKSVTGCGLHQEKREFGSLSLADQMETVKNSHYLRIPRSP
eukprot:m.310247 g.310247  ORF g.310247 m.310247 type:complete len:305 (+) comp50403_c0_seq1:101-1015(+)